MEVDDGPVGRWHCRSVGAPEVSAAPLEARTERSARVDGQGRLAMDAEHDLEERPEEPVAKGPVGKRRERGAEPPEQIGLADQPVPEAGAPARSHRGAGTVVDLGDLDARRAGSRAPAAARAPVDGAIRRVHLHAVEVDRHRGGEPEALGLRTHVLRAREPVVDPRDRAHLVADVALEALVGRQADRLVERLLHDRGDRHRTASALRPERFGFEGPPLRDAAARQALASATPSPHRSTITRWPASSPPTTRTLS